MGEAGDLTTPARDWRSERGSKMDEQKAMKIGMAWLATRAAATILLQELVHVNKGMSGGGSVVIGAPARECSVN
jgi:hypothetical protein